MFCKNCGRELTDNSKFCPGCGAKQDVKQEVPVQTTVNPVGSSNEYPVNQVTMPENNQNKKNNLVGKIAVLAVAVVVLVVGIILVVNIVSNSGAKGVINRFEDAINDYDAEETVECFAAYSLFLDEDDFEAIVEKMDERYDNLKYADFEVNFEIKGENDITEDDCDYDDMTCQEYYQEIYETMDEYDGQKIQTVKEVYVKVTCDYNSDYNDKVEDTAENYEAINKFYCVEFNGNWYIAHSDAILE